MVGASRYRPGRPRCENRKRQRLFASISGARAAVAGGKAFSETIARRAALEAAQALSAEAEAAAVAAEEATRHAQAALDAARPKLQEVETQLNRLDSEAQTLNRILNGGAKGLWAAIADELKVDAGFETALGAALGDDLEASSDAGAPLHWAGPSTAAAMRRCRAAPLRYRRMCRAARC